MFCVLLFFNDTATTEIYTLSLHDALPICFLYCPFLVAAAPHILYCPGSCCGSAPAFFTDHFSLRQRPRFLYCPFLVAAAPGFLFCLVAAFYTAHFSLRQRPHFIYCPFLVAAARRLFIITNSRCSSTPAFYTAHFSLRQRPSFLYCQFLVAAAPRFLYCPVFVAAAPTLFILTNSC